MKPANAVPLHVVPCSITDAKAHVGRLHRHHRPPVSGLFAVAVADDEGKIRGVAVVGRPVARRLDDGRTVEVTRVATDGTPNACSMLYGAAWRAARALGWSRAVTYTLPSEGGASLRGAGWRVVGSTPGRSWSCPSRPRDDAAQVLGLKFRWEAGA